MTELQTHTLNVKNIPFAVWTNAKQNAAASDPTWREFVIRLLDQSEPVPPEQHAPSRPSKWG